MTASALRLSRTGMSAPVLRAFRRAPSGMIGAGVVAAILVVAVLGPIVFGDEAQERDLTNASQGVSREHLLGTDALGRDILARLIVATRLSIGLGLASAALAMVAGILIGVSAALFGGRARVIVLRTIDTMISFPSILVAVFFSVILGRGVTGALIGVAASTAFHIARITSTLAISASRRDYVDAARVLGVRGRPLVVRYVLRNIGEPLTVAASVVVGSSIVTISALSFLGLGPQAPQYDWGTMLTEGVKAIYRTPAAALGPAGAIAISAFAFAFVGEAVARAMNPRLWTAPSGRAARAVATAPAATLVEQAAAAGRARPDERVEVGGKDGPPALEVTDLVISFPSAQGATEVIKGVTFSVGEGEIVGIVGESGSGKTMTALAVAQLVPYPGRVSGSVRLHGRELTDLSRKELDSLLGNDLAVVFQDPMASLNPRLTIGTQLGQAVRVHKGFSRRRARDLAVRSLAEVSIPAGETQLGRYPNEFSGGMRQRAMIAMGVMKEPSLLIADEPTTALDVTIQAQIMDVLHDINARHRTSMILISHDLALVKQNCHRVLVMYAGRIVEDLEADAIRTQAVHPYTKALVGTVPEIGQSRTGPLPDIPGEIPDPADPPPGCPFHPRCPLAVDRCSVERPPLLHRGGGHRAACHVANEGVE